MAGRQAKLAAEFLVQLKTVADLPRQRADVLLRAVAARVGEAVVVGNAYGPGTPVDTGNARGHWFATMGDVEPVRDSTADDARPTDQSRRAALTMQGMTKLATAAAQAKLGDVINYVNDVPYIEALNNGHSQQAPVGMTDAVVASFDQLVLGEAARLNIVVT